MMILNWILGKKYTIVRVETTSIGYIAETTLRINGSFSNSYYAKRVARFTQVQADREIKTYKPQSFPDYREIRYEVRRVM